MAIDDFLEKSEVRQDEDVNLLTKFLLKQRAKIKAGFLAGSIALIGGVVGGFYLGVTKPLETRAELSEMRSAGLESDLLKQQLIGDEAESKALIFELASKNDVEVYFNGKKAEEGHIVSLGSGKTLDVTVDVTQKDCLNYKNRTLCNYENKFDLEFGEGDILFHPQKLTKSKSSRNGLTRRYAQTFEMPKGNRSGLAEMTLKANSGKNNGLKNISYKSMFFPFTIGNSKNSIILLNKPSKRISGSKALFSFNLMNFGRKVENGYVQIESSSHCLEPAGLDSDFAGNRLYKSEDLIGRLGPGEVRRMDIMAHICGDNWDTLATDLSIKDYSGKNYFKFSSFESNIAGLVESLNKMGRLYSGRSQK